MKITKRNHLISQLGMISLLALSMICSSSLNQEVEAAPRIASKSVHKRNVKQSTRRVTKRKRVSRQSSSRSQVVASRSGHRVHYRGSNRRNHSHTVVHHRPYYAPTRTSSRSGVMNDILLEVGGQVFSPIQGEISSGLQLALGSRLGPVAGVVEAQFAQEEKGSAELQDLNAQLRVYLPLSPFVEMYPMVAVGHSTLGGDEGSSHLDLGIGAQLKLGDHLAVGGRYSARIISETEGGKPTNGHNLLASVSLKF